MSIGNFNKFKNARDNVFKIIDNPEAQDGFIWPVFDSFNWVNDWFDHLINNTSDALVIINEESVERYSFKELITSSSQVANWMQSSNINRGDMVFLHLDNRVELFQIMLAAIRVGVVIVPCSTSLSFQEINTRLGESGAKFLFITSNMVSKFNALTNDVKCVVVDSEHKGCISMNDVHMESDFFPIVKTLAKEPLFAYFTSGSTSRPKLVFHSHQSYPVGHLSSLMWNGTRKNDRHFNLSPPGWAKHSWSSLFVPWNAEGTNIVTNIKNVTPQRIIRILSDENINTFCAPPTFWRELFSQDEIFLKPHCLREIVSAGEPLEPSLVEVIYKQWEVYLRNGYGQTEATAIVGQLPGVKVTPGSIGRALPGYSLKILDIDTGQPSSRGELCIELDSRPAGIMIGYNSSKLNKEAFKDDLYHTNDICHIDEDGNYYLEGRRDNVFKSFDFRVSPYELEFILQDIDGVKSVAIVPYPNLSGGAVPRAYIVAKTSLLDHKSLVNRIFKHANKNFPPEFLLESLVISDSLPLTLTGKINREKLRLKALDDSYPSHDTQYINVL